jgi:hypothetical protein
MKLQIINFTTIRYILGSITLSAGQTAMTASSANIAVSTPEQSNHFKSIG